MTPLRGPRSQSFLFGLARVFRASDDASLLTEQWTKDYGPAFCVPGAFGSKRVVIVDPKAVTHFYSKETFGYVQTPLARTFIERLFGRGLLWAEGESHRRQRKALSPAFSNAAIRKLSSVFYDSAYKLKDAWDAMLDSTSADSMMIDVQTWMNHVSLDSIGIAGFGHDFGTLNGKVPAVVRVFESMNTGSSPFSILIFLLSQVFPFLLSVPTSDNKQWAELNKAMAQIADDLLERTRKEREGSLDGKSEEKSIIGQLTTDPTWEQLVSDLPYLDAIAHEVLRLHPPVTDTNRIAAEDDIIPLSTPATTSTGEMVTSIIIPKGTMVSSPIRMINRFEAFWGPDAKEFEPERWLDDADIPAKQLQGHRHILTFSDGPRICLGRNFALTEFKAALSVIIRNYAFELPDGPETKIERHRSILPRPKVAGEKGANVPMKVRRVDL
ncbi:hypothetical protein H0H93_008938 [Arthromyces matolae]|nr:hypothetical protein H0H93_008938 [Arthromyces matolae]